VLFSRTSKDPGTPFATLSSGVGPICHQGEGQQPILRHLDKVTSPPAP
jgi:hypothetical protein